MELSRSQMIIVLSILIPILLAQGAWIFQDARKRGDKYYWLWGLFGLLQTPSNLIIYLIVTRVIMGNRNKK